MSASILRFRTGGRLLLLTATSVTWSSLGFHDEKLEVPFMSQQQLEEKRGNFVSKCQSRRTHTHTHTKKPIEST